MGENSMKRKLIEVNQEYLVVCDNPQCDYKVKNGKNNEYVGKWLNMPCPECGENLLTEQDYMTHLKVIAMVECINKWFSWQTVFVPKDAPGSKVSVHIHDGVKIKEETK
jgi:hypothetical protein